MGGATLAGERVDVAVVDDDPVARAAVRDLLGDLAARLGIDLACTEYPSGAAILMEPPRSLDILFTDIDMPHVNGIEAAAEMRERHEDLAIVFITAFEEYAVQSYQVQAKRYLLKPVARQRFDREIAPLLPDVVYGRADTLTVKGPDGTHVVRRRNVVYIATTPSKTTVVHTRAVDVETRESLSDWERRLADVPFFRCHSGFLVNFAFVEHIGTADIDLLGGETVPLSKHRRKAFLEAFAAYMGSGR